MALPLAKKIVKHSDHKTQYEQLLPQAIESCVELALSRRKENLAELKSRKLVNGGDSLLKSARWRGEEAYLQRLTDEEFCAQRRALYRKIFDATFTKNGKVIPPAGSHKTHFLLAGTHGRSRRVDLLENLEQNAPSLPEAVRKSFAKINNGHAVTIYRRKIMEVIDEFQQTKKSFPVYIAWEEAKEISNALINLAKQCGYNIIDLTSSNSNPKTPLEIEILKSAPNQEPNKGAYRLSVFGLVGSLSAFIPNAKDKAEENFKPDWNYVELAKSGLKELSEPESFPKLMQAADESLLIWDHGPDKTQHRYDAVTSSKKGKRNIHDYALWNRFDSYQYIHVDKTSFYHPKPEKREEPKSWAEKEVARRSAQSAQERAA